MQGVVLDGYSAFARDDAFRAGSALLARGPARVKLASGIAGLGQYTVRDADALVQTLDAIDTEQVALGLVIEQNLIDVETYSVGQVQSGALVATYYGTQSLTRSNHGAEVYGGSQLIVARGDFDALLALDLTEDAKLAVAQARLYDEAARACFRGFYASRRNYDVAQGADGNGRRMSGVLEQSWRLGGASGAEIGALEMFAADSGLRAVRAETHECYGDLVKPPAHATVYFAGVDPRVGKLTKYTVARVHADTR